MNEQNKNIKPVVFTKLCIVLEVSFKTVRWFTKKTVYNVYVCRTSHYISYRRAIYRSLKTRFYSAPQKHRDLTDIFLSSTDQTFYTSRLGDYCHILRIYFVLRGERVFVYSQSQWVMTPLTENLLFSTNRIAP